MASIIIENCTTIAELEGRLISKITNELIDRLLELTRPELKEIGPGYLPRIDFAKKYGMSLKTVDNRVQDGTFTAKKVGRKVYILNNPFGG